MQMTPAQELAHELSHEIIATCAKFCDRHGVGARSMSEVQISLVACQVSLIAMLANHPNGELLRLAVADSMVDGTALEYIEDVKKQLRNLHGKGPLL